MRKTSDIKAVLTDIGGVVLRVHEERTMQALADLAGLAPEEIPPLLVTAPQVVDRVYTGQWSMRDAYEHSREPLRSAVSYAQFTEAWMAMLGEDFPGVREAYEALPESVSLYTLSNTSDLHLERMRRHWLYELSVGFYASCEIGMQKPDAEIFHFALGRMGVPPTAVLFFDDNEENVLAAGRLGIRGVLVDHPQTVARTLRERGIIP